MREINLFVVVVVVVVVVVNMPVTIQMSWEYVWVVDQVWGQDCWILEKFFFLRVYGPRRSRTNLVNKGFTAGSRERARWLHLARSGSQSQRAIWFVLPARGASHIIICTYWLIHLFSRKHFLTTKFFRTVFARAVRISSRAVRVFPALSIRCVRPSYGTFFLMVFQGICSRGRTGHLINKYI